MEDKNIEQVTGNSQTEEVAPVYTAMFGENSPPASFKTYRSAKLSLDQINSIMQDAYENKIESGDTFIPDFGGARERFAKAHEIKNGLWVSRDKTKEPDNTSQEK